MRGVTVYTCSSCGTVNAVTYRRRWWRYLNPRYFNHIKCPDCRSNGPNHSRTRVAKPYGFTYLSKEDQ